METVWLVDSCLPPDGIPQVAEPLRAPPLPSVVCASFIGAWRGAREELDLVEWLQLSEARFSMHPFPVDATSTSRADVSLRRVCQMYSNFCTFDFGSREFFTIFERYCDVRLKRLNILHSTLRVIYFTAEFAGEKERERERLAMRKISRGGRVEWM